MRKTFHNRKFNNVGNLAIELGGTAIAGTDYDQFAISESNPFMSLNGFSQWIYSAN
jgi:hypothetical protein